MGTYTYNSLNQRTQKLASGTTTNYVYGLNGLLYGEYTSAGALAREYIYLNGQPLAQVNTGSPETATYLHNDNPRHTTLRHEPGRDAGLVVLEQRCLWQWHAKRVGHGKPKNAGSIRRF